MLLNTAAPAIPPVTLINKTVPTPIVERDNPIAVAAAATAPAVNITAAPTTTAVTIPTNILKIDVQVLLNPIRIVES